MTSQLPYYYIGKDGKRVLARDLEDDRDRLREELVATLAGADALVRDAYEDCLRVIAIYQGDEGLQPNHLWSGDFAEAWEIGGADHLAVVQSRIKAIIERMWPRHDRG